MTRIPTVRYFQFPSFEVELYRLDGNAVDYWQDDRWQYAGISAEQLLADAEEFGREIDNPNVEA